MDEFQELSEYIEGKVQGVFEPYEMEIQKEEIGKLKPGQVYVEIGIDEGRSFFCASKFAKKGVLRIGIDINDPGPIFLKDGTQVSIGRAKFMQSEGVVGLEKDGFYVHGDANNFAKIFKEPFVDLLFIDGFHGYEDVRKNVDCWLPLMKKGSTIIFHDYIDPNSDGVKPVVDETFKNAEIIGELARVRL